MLNAYIFNLFNVGAIESSILKPNCKGFIGCSVFVSLICTILTPDFIELAIYNSISNIDDINISINNILQGKFKDGFSEIASELDMEHASIIGNWDSYIYINLNNVWSKFSDKFLSDKVTSFVLADDEFKLLAALRLENNSEITVQMNEYGRIKMLKKKRLLESDEIENYVSNDMKFGEVIQKFEDGTCCAMEVVESEKVK